MGVDGNWRSFRASGIRVMPRDLDWSAQAGESPAWSGKRLGQTSESLGRGVRAILDLAALGSKREYEQQDNEKYCAEDQPEDRSAEPVPAPLFREGSFPLGAVAEWPISRKFRVTGISLLPVPVDTHWRILPRHVAPPPQFGPI